jgi:nitroimidazol reductase NimA-like FMN-containing flavoprotein (pyridoxamine 5'-phosphate oxidase superfamily)
MNEVQSFMDKERLASLATVNQRGGPHVVPVFFTYKDGKVYVQSDRKSVKVRNLSGNRCVAVAVYTGEKAVIIKGKEEWSEKKKSFSRELKTTSTSTGSNLTRTGETR